MFGTHAYRCLILTLGLGYFWTGGPVLAQVTPPPSTTPLEREQSAVRSTPPSMQRAPASGFQPAPSSSSPGMTQGTLPRGSQEMNQAMVPRGSQAMSQGGGQLPRDANQEYRTYDLSPYTDKLTKFDKPQRAVVDWVLRETGTDVWFNEPFGFLNTNRNTLIAYHTPEMQEVVHKMVQRFVNGPTDAQVLKLRLLTVSSPSWRARAMPLIQDVSVQSPGVQAWLMTKENAAVLTAMLKQRSDTFEAQDAQMEIFNGQSQTVSRTKGRTYTRTIRQSANVWPPYEPEIAEVQEGYQLEISPLLETDGETIECVIRAHIDQVDKLVPVDMELPLPGGQVHRTRIEVPQVVSWRLHERFRWKHDMVLLLSCGVVADPNRGKGVSPLVNIERMFGNTPGRADALLFIEFSGRAAEGLAPLPRSASRPGDISRGRY